jgi:hypothetical protein
MAQEKKETGGRTRVFWVAVLSAGIAPSVIYPLEGSIGASWLTFGMARFDDLAAFSLGPLKAEMRETIAEANATLEQLRAVATSMATATLTDLMAGHFQVGMSFAKRLELHDMLMEQLKALGVSDEQRERVAEYWRKGIGVIYWRIIAPLAENKAVAVLGPGEEYRKFWTELHAMFDISTFEAPRGAQLEALWNMHGLLTP